MISLHSIVIIKLYCFLYRIPILHRLIFAGKELPDNLVLKDCDLGQNSILHAVRIIATERTSNKEQALVPLVASITVGDEGKPPVLGELAVQDTCKDLATPQVRPNIAVTSLRCSFSYNYL